ncbi:MAG: YraN family protein [Nitrosomonas sp.]|nr:YraN family protein [Nitrosomonas sp.]
MMLKGRDAEKQAELFLSQHALRLIVRNYRCRFGEIDLIMQDGNTLVFIEVRMRNSDRYGGAAASITVTKQAKIIQTAKHYISRQDYDMPCRFDAILISGNREIEWIQNAFGEV